MVLEKMLECNLYRIVLLGVRMNQKIVKIDMFKSKISLIRSTVIVLLSVISFFAEAKEPALSDTPVEIQSLVPVGGRLLAYKTADLNVDGRKDAFIVFEPMTSDSDDAMHQSRIAMVLIRDKNGRLNVTAQNDKAVFCKKCGGAWDDTFQGIKASQGKFSIVNEGGVGIRWKKEFIFKHEFNNDWFLYQVKASVIDANNHMRFKHRTLTYPKSLKKINFSQFSDNPSWLPTLR